MNEKEWIILAGILLFLIWRGSAMTAATSIAGPGNPTAPPTTTSTGVGPGNSIAYGGPVYAADGPQN